LWSLFLYFELDVILICIIGGRRGCDHMLVGFTTTYAITTYVMSSNLDQGEVYNIM